MIYTIHSRINQYISNSMSKITIVLFLAYILIQIYICNGYLKWTRPPVKYSQTRLNYNTQIPMNTGTDDGITNISKNMLDCNEKEDNYETLYTLIWYKCAECEQLLTDLSRSKIKILYIDGSYYFFDEDDSTNHPILYKDDKLVATDVFEIYAELFS